MKIVRFKHSEIDKERYDASIARSWNGKVYALSWYLDIAFPGWQLLATPDYGYVMPLPEKKKLGIPCLLQPLMCQQLGIFSDREITPSVRDSFLKRIKVPYCNIHLNAGNVMHPETLPLRENYVLELSDEYSLLKARYSKNTKSLLKKTTQFNLCLDEEIDVDFALQYVKDHSPHYTDKLYQVSCKIIQEAHRRGCAYLWGVRENDDPQSEVIAVVSFLLWNHCFYYLLPTSSSRGKELQAMRFLLDRFIEKHAGGEKRIDFEGSSVSSVARFYKSFGAEMKPYPLYKKTLWRI